MDRMDFRTRFEAYLEDDSGYFVDVFTDMGHMPFVNLCF